MLNNSQVEPNKKQRSVQQQWELLRQVVEDPSSVTEQMRDTLLVALQSQGALAAMDMPEQDIISMSLNTHKTTANSCLEGEYASLNDYRQAALEKLKAFISKPEKTGRGTLAWYKAELAIATERLNTITNDMALMAQKLDDTLSLAHQMAKAADQESEFMRRRGEILRKFN